MSYRGPVRGKEVTYTAFVTGSQNTKTLGTKNKVTNILSDVLNQQYRLGNTDSVLQC